MRRYLLAAIAFPLILATPASAALQWDGDAENGTGVFDTLLCSDLSVVNWGDSHGDIFEFHKAPGEERCEAMGAAGQTLDTGQTRWIGWYSTTSSDNVQTVFQWKSWGTGDQQQQNYPILMKVEDGQLKVWYVSPGEVWNAVGSASFSSGWHRIVLGVGIESDTSGWFQVYLDGQQIANVSSARTWDDMGNSPRWGTYGSTILNEDAYNWVDDLRMGSEQGDVS